MSMYDDRTQSLWALLFCQTYCQWPHLSEHVNGRLKSQLEEDLLHLIFKQDGALFHQDFVNHLNATLPGCWIGHAGNHDLPIAFWPL